MKISLALCAGASLLGLASLLLAPTPVGACSLIHPCEDLLETEQLSGMTVTRISGDGAEAPAWIQATAELSFDGFGSPRDLIVDETTFILWETY